MFDLKSAGENIDVSIRQGRLRLSFHRFNKRAQVDRLLIATADA